jgi:hypothetical protein
MNIHYNNFFLCCRLLGDFLLPSSNTLPHTYQELSLIMKDIGMEYQAIDACPNDHIIYYGQHETKLEFPQCGISRYQTDQVTNKVPTRFFIIFP